MLEKKLYTCCDELVLGLQAIRHNAPLLSEGRTEFVKTFAVHFKVVVYVILNLVMCCIQ